jgi:death-on-curing protein
MHPQSGVPRSFLLQSALQRPQDKWHYGNPSPAELAAAYAFGIVKSHPFLDGHKRTSLVVAETFLALNGFHFVATDQECVVAFEALAAGETTETNSPLGLLSVLQRQGCDRFSPAKPNVKVFDIPLSFAFVCVSQNKSSSGEHAVTPARRSPLRVVFDGWPAGSMTTRRGRWRLGLAEPSSPRRLRWAWTAAP